MIKEKILSKLNLLFIYICITIVIVMTASSVTLNIKDINIGIIVAELMASLIIAFLAVKLNRYNTKYFFVLLIFISFVLYAVWNIYAMSVPVSDYKVLLDGANKIVNGSFSQESFNKSDYFYFYNYQIGYASYLALVIKIFGNNLILLKILEGLYLTLTSITIYKITEKISTKDAGAVAAIFYAMYIPNIMGSSVINNQHISTLLLCLSLYFIVKATRLSLIAAGILLGFTQILRPIAIIIIIGLFIVYTFKMIKYKSYKELVSKFIVFIIAFIVVVKIFDITFMELKISPGPISKDNAKYFKFVLGLKGSGIYNIPTENAKKTQVYFDLKALNFDYNEYNKQCLKVIKESINNYRNTVPFVINKMYYFMGYKDNQYSFALNKEKINNYIYMLTQIGNIQYIFLLMGTVLILIDRLRSPINDIDIFCILIIGFILVHIFIETQPRYRYEVYVFTDILTSQFIFKVISKYPLFTQKIWKLNTKLFNIK